MRKPTANLSDLAAWASEATDAIQRNQVINRSNSILAQQLADGVLLEVKGGKTGGAQATQSNPYVIEMIITAVNTDTLTCRDPGQNNKVYSVRKPHLLQGGVTVYPPWNVNDKIDVLFPAFGGTPIDANVTGRGKAFLLKLCQQTGPTTWQQVDTWIVGGTA